jgi:hypothetical protein
MKSAVLLSFVPVGLKTNKNKLLNHLSLLQNVANFPEISWYIMAYYLDFIQLRYISLTFSFTFGPFECLRQNSGLLRNGSKFQNFGLGNGKI